MADPNSYFKKGAEVEISSDDAGFRGSWYAGKVISRSRTKVNDKVLVEYRTLMSEENETKPLKEKVDLFQLRPTAPRESSRTFCFGEEVDAYYSDGWWEGVITGVEGDKYTLYFRGTREELEFGSSDLRLHREWVDGEWVPPMEMKMAMNLEIGNENEIMSSTTLKEPCNDVVHNFGKGTLVEATSDEDGFQGAWFTATVIEEFSNNIYLIEYHSLTNDGNTELLKEKVSGVHLRPYPPEIALVGHFRLLEEVDALHNDGWWVGVISKVMVGQRYIVYFKGSNEEIEFKQSDLRPHQDWIDGKWVLASQA